MMKSVLLIILLSCAASLVQAQGRRVTTTTTSDTERGETESGQTTSRWTESANGNELVVTTRGEVRFNDDYTDVLSLSDDGSFRIREKRDGMVRQIEISARGGGELQRRYSVQGAAREYDGEARGQLARMLAAALRDGFYAEARARRMLRERGPEAVLDAASQARSDYAKKIWLATLAEADDLNHDVQRRVMNVVAGQMTSDYERAEVLTRTVRFDYGDKAVRSAFTEAVVRMTSDYERGRVLKALVVGQQKNKPEMLLLAVKSAALFSSDYEKAQALIVAANAGAADATLRAALVEAAQTINSDYERGRVLSVVFGKHGRE